MKIRLWFPLIQVRQQQAGKLCHFNFVLLNVQTTQTT